MRRIAIAAPLLCAVIVASTALNARADVYYSIQQGFILFFHNDASFYGQGDFAGCGGTGYVAVSPTQPYVYYDQAETSGCNGTPIGAIERDLAGGGDEERNWIPRSVLGNLGPLAADGQYLFFTDNGDIGRVNLDSTDPITDLFDPDPNPPSGSTPTVESVAADGTHVYWLTEFSEVNGSSPPSEVGRANLDGTGVDQDFITIPKDQGQTFVATTGLAVDPNYIYWTDDHGMADGSGHASTIGRAGINGADPDDNFIPNADEPASSDPFALGPPVQLAVDATRIYWTTGSSEYPVAAANLDGSNVNEHYVPGGGGDSINVGIAVDPCPCEAQASFTATPDPTVTGRYQFDASGSSADTYFAYDGTPAIVQYSWNFGDGTTGTDVAPAHTYTQGGSHTVTLTVTSDRGFTGSDSETLEPPTIAGKVTDLDGNPVPGVSLSFSSSEGSAATTTAADGTYTSPPLGVGTYTVTPALKSTKFNPSSQQVALNATNVTGVDFVAQLAHIRGTVSYPDDKPVAGARISLIPESGGADTASTTVTTGADGRYDSGLLDAGSYDVVPQPSTSFDPQRYANVDIGHGSQDDKDFTQLCVQPNPNGSPLPAGTPNPIPGVVTSGTLEAVGCFDRKPNSELFTSDEPVRLDGVDVQPLEGATITVDRGTARVTSDGPAMLGVGGYVVFHPRRLDLDFSAPALKSHSGDIAAAMTGFAPNLFGLPLSINTGGPVTSLPFTTEVGSSSATIKVAVPANLVGTWNPFAGRFDIEGLHDRLSIPTYSAQLTLTTTNRDGLTSPSFCAQVQGGDAPVGPFANVSIFGLTLRKLKFCFDLTKTPAALTAIPILGPVVPDLAGHWSVFAIVRMAFLPRQPDIDLKIDALNWHIVGFKIVFDGINQPVGEGIFLQRLGGGAQFDPNSGKITARSVNVGFSFWPGLSIAGLSRIESASADGELSISHDGATGSVTGNLRILRGTPFEMSLIDGEADLHADGSVDLRGTFKLPHQLLPKPFDFVFGDFSGTVRGFSQGTFGQLDGSGRITVEGVPVEGKLLVSSDGLAICANGIQFGYDFHSGHTDFERGGACDLSPFARPIGAGGGPAPDTAAATSAAQRFVLPRGLAWTTLAFRGNGGTPVLTLRGPGETINTSSPAPTARGRALYFSDPARETTYVVLLRPAAGRWSVTGSVPITSILESNPAAQPRISAKVSGTLCRRIVSYRASIPAGTRVTLYAGDGHGDRRLGEVHSGRGSFGYTPTITADGTGQILASTYRRANFEGISPVASYRTRVVVPGAVAGLHVDGRKLRWQARCGAAYYVVVIRWGGHSRTADPIKPMVTLPRVRGEIRVAITPVNESGTAGKTRMVKRRLH